MKIVKVPKEDWRVISKDAHLGVFGMKFEPVDERIDFALIAENELGVPMAYVTCREMDSKSLYWQYGGAFPGTKDTILSFRAYKEFCDWCMDRYDRIFTHIENTNTVMLKMAMKTGFLIFGIRTFKEWTLLEHRLELQ